MEAVPRLPMISFDLKVPTDITSFGAPLKQYIAAFYNEDPETYITEIHNLESLRSAATRPTDDVAGCQMLKKYYCQLHFLKSRFPMEEQQQAAVYFSWKDNYSSLACSVPDIQFELMAILYNIGAMHSHLGASDTRLTPDGMKIACTHFQCAAWAFQTVKQTYHQMVTYISSIEIVNFMELVCLAQAQECILEKSMMDNRKATIIAKVAVQVVDYYRRGLHSLETNNDDSTYNDFIRTKTYKDWVKYVNFKIAYHKCIALLYQGQQAEEQQKMGERVAFYQAAIEQLEEARKLSNNLDNKHEIAESLAFTSDVVEGKKKAAKNENEFIYHEEVPNKNVLEEVKGASLVKGIPFSVTDIEVSGPDLFARLVPMAAHEASSLYSEKKAQLLRQYGELIESKDQSLVEFMSSMQLEIIHEMRLATGLPQDIVDRAAALSARTNAIQNLINSMGKLSNSYQEVESMLTEIQELLKEEEQSEREYQKSVGERPPGIIATDLSREAAKYREAHNKANDSNQNLHKAMMMHVTNLKTLSQPLTQLQSQIPSVNLTDPNVDEQSLKEIEMLLGKVEEMRTQRAILWAQLRDSIHKDDITSVLVTRQADKPVDNLFQEELQKHQQLTHLIEQNVSAQENIIKAFIDAYARFSNTRRYLQGIISRRSSTLSSLITSFDTYEDLLSKANKGIEFYNKLETNVTKVLQRIRSACKVQQEERDQMLAKVPTVAKVEPTVSAPESSGPKLKDYLDSIKKNPNPNPPNNPYYTGPNYAPPVQNSSDGQVWPPGIRPAPLGSEVNDISAAQYDSQNAIYQNYNYQTMKSNERSDVPKDSRNDGYYNNATHYVPRGQVSADGHIEQILVDKMNSLMGKDPGTRASQYSYNPMQPSQNFSNYSYSSPYIPPTYTGTQNLPTATPTSLESPANYAAFTYAPASAVQSNVPISAVNSYESVANNPKMSSYTPGFTPQLPASDVSSVGSTYPNQYIDQTSNIQYSYQYPQGNFVSYSQANMNYGQIPIASGGSGSLSQISQGGYTNMARQNLGHSFETPNNTLTTVSSNNAIPQGHTFASNYAISANTNNVPTQNYEYNTPANFQDYNTGNPAYAVQYSTSNTNQENVGYATGQFGAGYVGAASLTQHQYNTTSMYTQAQNGFSYNTNNSTSSSGGVASPICTPPQPTMNSSYSHIPNSSVGATTITIQPHPQTQKQSSNIDLLSGLDFSLSQAPLIPQQKKEEAASPQVKSFPVQDESSHVVNTPVRHVEQLVCKKSLDNAEVKKLFANEIDKYEKSVEVLSNKTLSGPTNLDLRWKEIQDKQDIEGQKKIISVARCYPMKNRFPDILPYDHSRVQLVSTKDDYINASYIKDISPFVPTIIVTQAPQASTIAEFWTMILEQHVEFVMCLLSDSEIGEDMYWPSEKGKDLYVLNMVISLQSVIVKAYWIERLISINIPDKRESSTIVHLQFTGWPGSLFPISPDPFVSYVKEFVTLYQQQRLHHHPMVVHCLSGIGRSGVACLLITAILEATNKPTLIPDLVYWTNEITACKRNILRDREHLKFGFQSFLAYMKQISSPEKYLKVDESQILTEKSQSDKQKDPLNTLDPFWASKKK